MWWEKLKFGGGVSQSVRPNTIAPSLHEKTYRQAPGRVSSHHRRGPHHPPMPSPPLPLTLALPIITITPCIEILQMQ
jgi:hypothetical protein